MVYILYAINKRMLSMLKNVNLKVICPYCGSPFLTMPNDFDFDFETNFADVSCVECGREINKDDVVQQDIAETRKRDDETMKAIFKGTMWDRK